MSAARHWLAVHRKLVVFVVGAALTACIQAFGTNNPWVSLGVLVATGAGVYQAPNASPAPIPPSAATAVRPPEQQQR